MNSPLLTIAPLWEPVLPSLPAPAMASVPSAIVVAYGTDAALFSPDAGLLSLHDVVRPARRLHVSDGLRVFRVGEAAP